MNRVVTVEVNPWGTSQQCSRCGAKGERFSVSGGQRVRWKGGKLFWCPVCHYSPMRTTMAVPTCITVSLLSSVGNPSQA